MPDRCDEREDTYRKSKISSCLDRFRGIVLDLKNVNEPIENIGICTVQIATLSFINKRNSYILRR